MVKRVRNLLVSIWGASGPMIEFPAVSQSNQRPSTGPMLLLVIRRTSNGIGIRCPPIGWLGLFSSSSGASLLRCGTIDGAARKCRSTLTDSAAYSRLMLVSATPPRATTPQNDDTSPRYFTSIAVAE